MYGNVSYHIVTSRKQRSHEDDKASNDEMSPGENAPSCEDTIDSRQQAETESAPALCNICKKKKNMFTVLRLFFLIHSYTAFRAYL